MPKEKNPNYVNNAVFYEQLKVWKESGDPRIPDSIAKTIHQICKNLAMSGRFVGYTWREDMVSEAVLYCISSVQKFNPAKSSNPFAYFTQIAYNTFRRYLNIEHLRLATLESYKQSLDIIYDTDDQEDEYGQILESAKKCDTQYQKNYKAKTPKKKKKIASDFFE